MTKDCLFHMCPYLYAVGHVPPADFLSPCPSFWYHTDFSLMRSWYDRLPACLITCGRYP